MLYLLLFVSLTSAAPLYNKNITVTTKFFPESFVIYSGNHDIIEITIPVNELNNHGIVKNEPGKPDRDYIFFVEADLTPDGTKDYKGMYVLKNGQAKKILENGQSVTYGQKRKIYIGASDGIYKYNYNDDTVQKHSNETRNVIKMRATVMNRDIYYLTSDYILRKFDKDELTSTEVQVKDVRDFVFGFTGNIFYYDGSNQFYFYDGVNVVKIEGLPAAPTKVAFVNTPVTVSGHEAYAVVDGSVYGMNGTGVSEFQNVIFDVQPTAYAPEIVYVQFYAYKKKIYDYNLLTLTDTLTDDIVHDLLEDKEDKINTIAKAGNFHT